MFKINCDKEEKAAQKEHFWRGDIRTKSHARHICRLAGTFFLIEWSFLMLCGVWMILNHGRNPISLAGFSLLVALPALFLRQTCSFAAARLLYLQGILGLLLAIVLTVWSIYRQFLTDTMYVNLYVLIALLQGAVFFKVAQRAEKAASVLYYGRV